MSSQPLFLNRRTLLQMSLAGLGVAGAAIALPQVLNKPKISAAKIPAFSPEEAHNTGNDFNPMAILRDFDYGTVKKENGRTIREYRLVANTTEIKLNNAVTFNSWNVNKRVPGPTLRATEGDRLRIIFLNQAGHSHSLHFHGIHRSEMDGVKPIRHDTATIYEFDAEPYGVHLYHCHIEPVTRHINRGLYGMFIIDPPKPRPPLLASLLK